jgi:hypothetical protein
VMPLLALVAGVGVVRWLVRPAVAAPVFRAVVLLAGVLLVVSFATVSRPLPLLTDAPLPVARYLFPAIIPLALAILGGLFAVWPARYHTRVALVMAAALVVLDLAALATIRAYFAAL